MNKTQFIQLMNRNLKQVRLEYGLSQDKMAIMLGLSKKTLIEIEKGRSSLGWMGSVVLASIFSNSSILVHLIGENVEDMIFAIAFQDTKVNYPKTLGGIAFWKVIRNKNGFIIQQNIISHHYRLLDQENRRHIASFNLEEIEEYIESNVNDLQTQ